MRRGFILPVQSTARCFCAPSVNVKHLMLSFISMYMQRVTIHMITVNTDYSISIHTPHVGSDGYMDDELRESVFQSTLPHVGSDKRRRILLLRHHLFQSTLPM